VAAGGRAGEQAALPAGHRDRSRLRGGVQRPRYCVLQRGTGAGIRPVHAEGVRDPREGVGSTPSITTS
jgi:hypothetical protein